MREPRPNHPTPLSARRILLVEDDQRIADFVRRGLQAEGYQVELAASGRQALNFAAVGEFQLMILDLGLPDIDGQQVCERMRAQGVPVPVLMLTARATLQDKVTGLRAGADDYLTKPFAFEELLARIEALLRRRGTGVAPEPRELRMADLLMNTEKHEVRRGGVLVELTPREYRLLECFLRMPGKVLSRTRILELVWGYGTDPLTNVVDVYIRQLRRKIDDGHDLKLIKTVRGFGYRLDEGTS